MRRSRPAKCRSPGARPSVRRSNARPASASKAARCSSTPSARNGRAKSADPPASSSTACRPCSAPAPSSRFRYASVRESVIVSAVRTPTGKFLGALKALTATQLGALAVAEAVRRAGIEPGLVDECIMGNVVGAGLGQNPARQAALRGGLADHVAALTINKVCGSGLKAVMLAHQGIATGDIEIAVAGGMESMSNCPYLMPRARDGARMGNTPIVDSMINDGLWCAFENYHMGNAGEVVASQYGVGRDAQDAFAVRSHQRAALATEAGAFTDEILPVPLPQRDGSVKLFDRDESIRADTTAEALRALKPAF